MTTIDKTIITVGDFGKKPSEDSKCLIKLSNLIFECLSKPSLKFGSIKTTFLVNEVFPFIIGNVDYDFDILIESAVKTMYHKEISDFTLKSKISVKKIVYDILVKVRIEFTSLIFVGYIHELINVHKAHVALRHKDKGVYMFKKGEHYLAFKRFSKALKSLISIGDLAKSGMSKEDCDMTLCLKRDLYNNLALCRQNIKSRDPTANLQHIVYLCEQVLKIDSNNIKALMRLGKAKTELKDYEDAVDVLKRILNLEPSNSSARNDLIKLTDVIRKQNQNSDQIVKKMFSNIL